LGSFALIFLVYRQKSRNRRLKLERKQQKANEEIYDLMIKQQYKREEGRLEERVRISEELHDGALARLFSVRMGMGYLEESDNEEEREQYQTFMDELKMVEKEIRAISHALKNEGHSTKKDFGLLLEELLEEQSKLGDFEGKLINEHDIAWDQVDEKIKMNLFRIVQEALHNIIKYAQCRQAAIRFYKDNGAVNMEIEDDGIGFKTGKKPKGIGLRNMKSRTGVIGASLSIWSEPDKGSRITISIPTKTLYHDAEE
jgi:signal transduction histidine kinase